MLLAGMNNLKDVVEQLDKAIDDVLMLDVQSINWDGKPASDKWSKKQIIGHLIDSAQINLQRFVRCTYEEGFKLIYEQVEWVEANRYEHADIGELLLLWTSLNKQIVRVMANYPGERLNVQCDNGKASATFHTVEWLMQDYVDHLNHHLNQALK
jgi:hypothetical protein